MTTCRLIRELSRLRKSSSESIDNANSFADFKVYMHVVREVETDLKELLAKVNEGNKKKLILLCGSAGDGKSHLLSYLKNTDSEKLLDNIRIYNDATESSSPKKTAIETLNEKLNDFSDEKLSDEGDSLILAINLGVLNNFIESDYGERFTRLKQYVIDNKILQNYPVKYEFDQESPFHHVNFADYHLYSLTKDGPKSDFIMSLMKKIYGDNNDNPFYKACREECGSCSLKMKCPVRYNYLFLSTQEMMDYVSKLLIKTSIKEKDVLTTREVLNYLYDVTVPQDFTKHDLSKKVNTNGNCIKYFLNSITPS